MPRFSLIYVVFFVEFIHQIDVHEYQNYENVNRALLRKPEAELEAA